MVSNLSKDLNIPTLFKHSLPKKIKCVFIIRMFGKKLHCLSLANTFGVFQSGMCEIAIQKQMNEMGWDGTG